MSLESVWAKRVADTIFPLSHEQHDFKKALQEWKFTGAVVRFDQNDDDEPLTYEDYPPCDLCDYPHIKTGYVIRNILTGEELTIGCECIKRFQPDTDEAEINKIHVLKCLDRLRWNRCRVNISSLEDYYLNEGAFTPKQLVLVFTLLERYKEKYNPICFKVKLRRDREKAQLEVISDRDLELIRPALSSVQVKKLMEDGIL
jgi:hypothetical protein